MTDQLYPLPQAVETGIIGFIGGILGLSWGNIGLMEKKMETTI